MKLSRLGLTIVLVSPVVFAGGLYAYARSEAAHRREARGAGALADRPALSQPATPDAKLVKPETLDQGFVLVVKDLSGLASANSPIYLASSHNGWNPSDPKQQLSGRSDLRWQIELPKPTKDGPLEFKFTRGSWDLCEVSADLQDVSNRLLPKIDAAKLKPGEKPVFEFEIPKWADQRPNSAQRPDLNPYYELSGIKGTVRRLQVQGGGVPMLRDLLVWLPPGYDDAANKETRYPVVYLQDGQNLFMKMPGTPAAWGADTTAHDLITKREVEPFIIVGVPHSGANRIKEYVPDALAPGQEFAGEKYVDFLVSEVMPRVERSFRVKTGPENTAIGGASLGAIISMDAACRHPDIFGTVVLESPSLTLAKGAALDFFEKQKTWPKRIYLGYGGKELGADPKLDAENKAYVAACKRFEEMIKARASAAAGTGRGYLFRAEGDAQHNEEAWAARFPSAVNFMFAVKK